MVDGTVAADGSRPSAGQRSRLVFAAVAALNLVVGALYLAAPQVTERLDPRLVRPEAGHAWTTGEPAHRLAFPYRLRSDTMAAPRASDAVLLEDGKPLGPPHSVHDDIRKLGAGRYSFWYRTLYFSTADNSDPRADGHAYTVRYDAALSPLLIWSLFVIDAAALLAFRGHVAAWTARWGTIAVAIGIAILFLRIAAAAIGLAPPLFAGSASLIDTAFVWALLLHLGLGIAVTAAIFGCGGGLVRLCRRGDPSLGDLLLGAFLPGTLLLAAAAALVLAVPHGGVLALALLACSLLPLHGYRPERAALARAGEVVLLSLPAAAALGAVMSFRWHGPTGTLAGAPLGDMTTYAAWANTLTQHLAPLPNYGVEGATAGYGHQLVPLLMAALLRFSWFDPYLFMSASLVVMLALSLAVMISLLAGSGAANSSGSLWRWTVIGLVIASPTYPSWVVESPPVAFLLPIVISTFYLSRHAVGRPIAATGTVILGAAVSKIVAAAVFVPLLLPDFRRMAVGRLKLLLPAFAVAALLIAVPLRAYLPEYLGIARFGPLSWDWIVTSRQTALPAAAAVVSYDLGAVLLAAAATRLGSPGVALAGWSGVACYFAMAFLFQAALTTVMLVVSLALIENPGRYLRARGMLIAATLLLLPRPLSFDWGGPAVVAAWVLCVGFILAVALSPIRFGWRRQGAAVFAILFLAILPAAGIGAVAAGPADDRLLFTQEMRDIWLAVRHQTPPDALVFTDQTGASEDWTGGWNSYALMAQRQFFLVSWVEAPLRWHPAARARMLQQNEAVLSGALAPSAVSLSRHYDGYFAVISNNRAPPPGAQFVYRNSRYSLYRLRG
jgi:hypothetical protein